MLFAGRPASAEMTRTKGSQAVSAPRDREDGEIAINVSSSAWAAVSTG